MNNHTPPPNTHTPHTFTTALGAELARLVPEVVVDGQVDVTRVRQLLGADALAAPERFELTWPGKRAAQLAVHTTPEVTLQPVPGASVEWDTTQNVFIEGDNLDVLKLLQHSYHERVKMIFIDPPYNTGNDFVYPDNFSDSMATYRRLTSPRAGRVTSGGGRAKAGLNHETDGRFHSRWLSMMYPRLRLARNLLAPDGVLAVAIDDHEVANLTKLLAEVFGESHYVGTVVWQHAQQTKNDEPFLARNHNYVVLFRKSSARTSFRVPRLAEHNKYYANPDHDPRGPWRSGDVRSPSVRETLRYPVTTPSGRTIEPPERGWRWSQATMRAKIDSGEVVFSADEDRLVRKIYLADQRGRVAGSVWSGDQVGTTRSATAQLKELFAGQVVFDTPKPTQLVVSLLELLSFDEDFQDCVVLDFFAGSGTTGQAVAELNAQDGGRRRWVQVQLPQPLPKAKKGGLATISDVARERLRRAREQVTELAAQRGFQVDTGFRVFEVTAATLGVRRAEALLNQVARGVPESELVTGQPATGLPATAQSTTGSTLAPRGKRSSVSAHQWLTQVAQGDSAAASLPHVWLEVGLRLGLPLAANVQRLNIAGWPVTSVAQGELLVCESTTEKFGAVHCEALVAAAPRHVFVPDYFFAGADALRVSFAHACAAQGIGWWTA